MYKEGLELNNLQLFITKPNQTKPNQKVWFIITIPNLSHILNTDISINIFLFQDMPTILTFLFVFFF